MLAAYLAGQVPAGLLADRLGGLRVLLVGLALWSGATALTALAAAPAPPAALTALTTALGSGGAAAKAVAGADGAVAVLYVSRVLLGLSSACAMPCVTATTVEWVPARSRSGAVSLIYALFNIGR
jgi:MFS family permease